MFQHMTRPFKASMGACKAKCGLLGCSLLFHIQALFWRLFHVPQNKGHQTLFSGSLLPQKGFSRFLAGHAGVACSYECMFSMHTTHLLRCRYMQPVIVDAGLMRRLGRSVP